MAARKYKMDIGIPLTTIVTVVAENEKEIVLKDMEYGNALELLKRKSSYNYKFYQKGYCAIKPKKK